MRAKPLLGKIADSGGRLATTTSNAIKWVSMMMFSSISNISAVSWKYVQIAFMAIPTTVIAGITVPHTPLIQTAIHHTKSESPPWLFNHVMRSWLYAVKIAEVEKSAVNGETLALAAILHDLGLVKKYETPERRFEVDGASAAIEFLHTHAEESSVATAESYKLKYRDQLIWEAIALHATPTIAHHSAPEVALCQRGIAIDYGGWGAEVLPNAASVFDAVLKEFPRLGMKDQMKESLCALAHDKPATTYDNFVGAFGEAYVKGYVRLKGDEDTVVGLQNNPFEK